MLKVAFDVIVDMPWEVNFAVLANDLTLAVSQNRGIEMAPFWR